MGATRKVAAVCHPDQLGRLDNGLCDRCHRLDRYKNDADYRERAKAASRQAWHKKVREYTPEQLERRRIAARERYHQDPRPTQSIVLRGKYGITLDEYDVMLEAQGGVCAICGKHPNDQDRRLSVDHDHESGNIRGILCKDCNTGLGHFGDDPERLNAAIRYLTAHRGE